MDEKKEPDIGTELSARQQQLIVELVKNTDIQAACKAAGIGRTTAYRWLGEADFTDELARLRNEAMKEALGSVKSHTARAAQELVRLLDTEDERLRRHICNDILGHAIKVREIEEIERRLMVLEKQVNPNNKWRSR